jgi:hypothetical protein
MVVQHMEQMYGIALNPESGLWDVFAGRLDLTEEDEDGELLQDGQRHSVQLPEEAGFRGRAPLRGNALELRIEGSYRPVVGDATSLRVTGLYSHAESSDSSSSPQAVPWMDVELSFTLPNTSFPSMLLRELTKLDVNSGDMLDLASCTSLVGNGDA